MKKVLLICIAATFMATGCDWFKKPNDNTVVTTVNNDSLSTNADTAQHRQDNTLVVPDTAKNAGKRI